MSISVEEIHTHAEESILHVDEPVEAKGWTYQCINGKYGLCCPKCGGLEGGSS